jgi:beta-galactosidase
VAWQVDNEFWEECFCPRCEEAFRAWLKKRFGTIKALNQAWLTVLWSQEYQSFDQVPLFQSHATSPATLSAGDPTRLPV